MATGEHHPFPSMATKLAPEPEKQKQLFLPVAAEQIARLIGGGRRMKPGVEQATGTVGQ